ncbi:hypothetical protein GOBAR_AA38147 [Gossypium barbadense]|uniref:Uncharacterized protein n=1 Tax=Gossypium barbadense TaxID=3634 RepID=A0A2P5VUU0_GOSBA|nr:hypothetical protein GOBAR_AA38147 [Gossypium barbadense]
MDASEDLKQFSDTDRGGAVFDASQYAFFGNDVLEEVELGGLDGDDEDLPAAGLDEEEFLFDQEEGGVLRALSDTDDLESTFSKLNTAVSRPRGSGIIGDRGSREKAFHVFYLPSVLIVEL